MSPVKGWKTSWLEGVSSQGGKSLLMICHITEEVEGWFVCLWVV